MTTEKSILVIYHGGCADGFTAAWAAWRKFRDTAEYYPGIYNNPPPDCKNKEVYIVDFSYSLNVMREICKQAKKVVMLDHHKSAFEVFNTLNPEKLNNSDAELNFSGIFREDESGAKIAWKYFYPDVPVPRFVEIISDRDLWTFKYSYTRNVMAAIFSCTYEFDIWNHLCDECNTQAGLMDLSLQGEAIERKHHKDIAELVEENKYLCHIAGYEVYVCNLPKTLTSDAGHLMAEGKPFAACYWDTPQGRVFSLRSQENGLDVSEIAKLFGGGGHKHAAGFRIGFDNIEFHIKTLRMLYVIP